MLSLRRRRAPGARRPRGFTLIELVVTVSVAAVMLSLAAPSFVRFQRSSELTSAANSFVAALSAARAEAMKRQLNTMVVPLSGSDWTQGYRVFVDANWNYTYNAANDVLVTTQSAMPAGISVDADGTTNNGSPYVMFSGSGFVVDVTTGNPAVLTEYLTLKNTSGGQTQKRMILINTAGRLRVCDPVADASCTNASDL